MRRAVSALAFCAAVQCFGQDAADRRQQIDHGKKLQSAGRFLESREAFEEALRRASVGSKTGRRYALSLSLLGGVDIQIGDYSSALVHLEKALAAAESAPGALPEDLLSIFNNLGLVHRRLNRFVEAEAIYNEAIIFATRQFGPTHVQTTSVVFNRAHLRVDLGQFAEARQEVESLSA